MALNEGSGSPFNPKPFGRYVLMDKLAVGGMAEIYKAKTYGVDGFEKLLAIKRILPHCAADKEFIHMLVDEAKLTVLLSHANIVQVFDLGKVADDYFISMEFIHGTNLREMMNRRREHGDPMPEEIAVFVMSEVCKGLDYAHRKTDSQGNPLNIVHRDISPQNILISFEGEVKIVDFGIAKAAMNVSHTMAGILKGKIAYMSPEQALGKPIDHRTDIFSAGVVLYEMLTGEKLFTGETQFEVLNQIRTTRVTTLMLPDTIPGPLKAILAKALAYNIRDRYRSAGDFQIDLTKYLYSSHIDFSPRQLGLLLGQLFEKEIHRKEAPVALDEKTRSVMIQQVGSENIVVHGADKAPAFGRSSKQQSFESSITHPSRTAGARSGSRRLWAAGAVMALLALLAAGYGAYRQFWKPAPVTENEAVSNPARLDVTSVPAGARILLNGRDTGLMTPHSVEKLEPGPYQVTLTKENYKDALKPVDLVAGQVLALQENLEPLPRISTGSLDVDSTPTGARIYINGQDTGRLTPATFDNLEAGKPYAVTLVRFGFDNWAVNAAIEGGRTTPIVASLKELTTPPPVPTPQIPTPTTPDTPKDLGFGSLRVTSDPKGARIFLNGANTGKTTPAVFDKIPAGKKMTVSLAREGYKDWSRTVTVETNKSAPVAASLKQKEETPEPTVKEPAVKEPVVEEPSAAGGKAGSLAINSDPSGAEVFVNSEYKGKTPLTAGNLPAGTVKVTVSKEGFMKYTTTVRLGSGENKSLGTINLGDMFGEVSISSTPSRAAVFFDGEAIGAKTPVTIRKVPRDRSHSIQVQLDGYRSWSSNVNLRDQSSRKYDVQLEKE